VTSTLETDDTIIGGEGIVIQIDETKMGMFLIQEKESITGVTM
jgi:hypothetical protein